MDTTGTDRREYLAIPVEERPHLYPDKPSSNTTYNGWGENLGCRCSLCTEAHRVAAREYLEAKIAGTWTDRRKTGKTRGLIHDLAEMADRYPELNTMLQRYGHRPVVIQIEPESVVDRPIPVDPIDEPAPAAEAISGTPDGATDPQPSQPVYAPVRLTADEVAARVLKAAVDMTDTTGRLEHWVLSATEIATKFGVPVDVAQLAMRINSPFIRVDAYLRGPKLIRRPGR